MQRRSFLTKLLAVPFVFKAFDALGMVEDAPDEVVDTLDETWRVYRQLTDDRLTCSTHSSSLWSRSAYDLDLSNRHPSVEDLRRRDS